MKQKTAWMLLALLMLAGCQQARMMSHEQVREVLAKAPQTEPEYRRYDVPPQVVYRIDDHRFITLESYVRCFGEIWYNDTRTGVRTKVGNRWLGGYQGKLIIDDPTGMNVAIPTVQTGGCGDRGCRNYLAYSTDGGRNFDWMRYDKVGGTDAVDKSKDYKIVVLKDRLYIVHKYGVDYVNQYPMVSGISLTKPFPEGIRGDSFAAQDRPEYLKSVHTPTGQEGYVCDATINP